MTNKVEISKKYKTRSGMAARVICTDAKDDKYPVIVLVTEGGVERVRRYTKSGQYYEGGTGNGYDLIEVSPWDDFKVDEPVMVRASADKPWIKRYFAGVVGGQPRTWISGATSWSSYDELTTVTWFQCRRPTEEELQTKATP